MIFPRFEFPQILKSLLQIRASMNTRIHALSAQSLVTMFPQGVENASGNNHGEPQKADVGYVSPLEKPKLAARQEFI